MIEFTIVLLIMVTLLFGVFETGRLLLAYLTLADAARAGTRYAVVHGSYASPSSGPGCDASPKAPGLSVAPNVAAVVQNITDAGGLSITVEVCYAGGNTTGGAVTVTAYYAYASPVSVVGIPAFTVSSTSQGLISY